MTYNIYISRVYFQDIPSKEKKKKGKSYFDG